MTSQVVFKELEVGNYFRCTPTQDEWALSVGLTHEYDTECAGKRFLKLLKTVAYVAVDEDEFGLPVCEKWVIRQLPPEQIQ